MADTIQEEPPHTNGIDSHPDDDRPTRPADIDADVREMERRKRVENIMNSRMFREELERIIETQMGDGAGANTLMQQIQDMMGVNKQAGNVYKNSSCVVPINDIRGIEAMGYEKGEKILRCKLAAVYRLIDLYGWVTGPHTLITARLNQDEENFLVNPHGMLYHEITASSLIKVDMQANVVEQGTTNFSVNISAFSLHGAVHAFRPDIKCIIHIHTPSVVAVSALKPGLLPLSQESVVIGDVSVHPYLGGILDQEEQEKLARNLGPNNKILLLSNQGALCCGQTIEEAFFNARNTILACETQLKLLPVGIDNLVLLTDEAKKKIYDAAHTAPESSPRPDKPTILEGKIERKWRVGGVEFEGLMRMLDNVGFRTGYIYRHPLVKGEPPKPKNDCEVPPAVSSLGYLIEEEELYKKGLWKNLGRGHKGKWLNSPNTYQRVEILETGTQDPKKITKWVADGSPTHSSTPVKIEGALQFVPKNTNPKEFKLKQQQIKDYRRSDKISAGPQSYILDSVSWEEARQMQDAAVTQTGEQVVLMGAASKGIIQRGHQHNAQVYKAPYASNPFQSVTDQEIDDYKKVVEKKVKGDYDTDYSESELSSAHINKRMDGLHLRSPTSETEEESRDEPQVLRIQTKTVPRASQPEVVLSDDHFNFNHENHAENNAYRTNRFSGLPQGSYSVPNPIHFHVVHKNHCATLMRPTLVKIAPYNISSGYVFNHNKFRGQTNGQTTLTLNLKDANSISVDISLDMLREFIYPFADALNLNNLPVLNSQACQTAYMSNFDHKKMSLTYLEKLEHTPFDCESMSSDFSFKSDQSKDLERNILENMKIKMLSNNSVETQVQREETPVYSTKNFTQEDSPLANESTIEYDSFDPYIISYINSSNDSQVVDDSFEYEDCYHEDAILPTPKKDTLQPNSDEIMLNNVKDFFKNFKRSVTPKNLFPDSQNLGQKLSPKEVSECCFVSSKTEPKVEKLVGYLVENIDPSTAQPKLELFEKKCRQNARNKRKNKENVNDSSRDLFEDEESLLKHQNLIINTYQPLEKTSKTLKEQDNLQISSKLPLNEENTNEDYNNLQNEDNNLQLQIDNIFEAENVENELRDSSNDEIKKIFEDNKDTPTTEESSNEDMKKLLEEHQKLIEEDNNRNDLDKNELDNDILKKNDLLNQNNDLLNQNNDKMNQNKDKMNQNTGNKEQSSNPSEEFLKLFNFGTTKQNTKEKPFTKMFFGNKDIPKQEKSSNEDLVKKFEQYNYEKMSLKDNIASNENANAQNLKEDTRLEDKSSNEDLAHKNEKKLENKDLKPIIRENEKEKIVKSEKEVLLKKNSEEIGKNTIQKKHDTKDLNPKIFEDREKIFKVEKEDLFKKKIEETDLTIDKKHDTKNSKAKTREDRENILQAEKEELLKKNSEEMYKKTIQKKHDTVYFNAKTREDMKKMVKAEKEIYLKKNSAEISKKSIDKKHHTDNFKAKMDEDREKIHEAENEHLLKKKIEEMDKKTIDKKHNTDDLHPKIRDNEKNIKTEKEDLLKKKSEEIVKKDKITHDVKINEEIPHIQDKDKTKLDNLKEENAQSSKTNTIIKIAEDYSSKIIKITQNMNIISSAVFDVKEILSQMPFFTINNEEIVLNITNSSLDESKNAKIAKNSNSTSERNDLEVDLQNDESIDGSIESMDEGVYFSDNSSIIQVILPENDFRIIEFGKIILVYLEQQCFEVRELVLFPELLYDESINKLLAKLKLMYDDFYPNSLNNDKKNDLRLSISRYVLKQLEIEENNASDASQKSTSNLVSDKIFTITEFVSDILDNFFSVVSDSTKLTLKEDKNGENFLDFTRPLQGKNGNLMHSTPEIEVIPSNENSNNVKKTPFNDDIALNNDSINKSNDSINKSNDSMNKSNITPNFGSNNDNATIIVHGNVTNDIFNDRSNVKNPTNVNLDTMTSKNAIKSNVIDILSSNDAQKVRNDTQASKVTKKPSNDNQIFGNDTKKVKNTQMPICKGNAARNDTKKAQKVSNVTKKASYDTQAIKVTKKATKDSQNVNNDIPNIKNTQKSTKDPNNARNDTKKAQKVNNDTKKASNNTQASNVTKKLSNDNQNVRNDIKKVEDTQKSSKDPNNARNDTKKTSNDTSDYNNVPSEASNDTSAPLHSNDNDTHVLNVTYVTNDILSNVALKNDNDCLKNDNDTPISDNDSLKSGNKSLKSGNESLKSGNKSLRSDNESLKTDNESLKTGNDASIPGNDSQKIQICVNKTDSEVVTLFKKNKSTKSGAELFWISCTPRRNDNDNMTLPLKPRSVVNVDDIPLRPPEDIETLKALYSIPEEPRCNLFDNYAETSDSDCVSDRFDLDHYLAQLTQQNKTDNDKLDDILAGGDNNMTSSYISFDKPEINVVVCNEVTFFRTCTVNTSAYVQKNVVTFSKGHKEVVMTPKEEEEVSDLYITAHDFIENDLGNWSGYESAKF